MSTLGEERVQNRTRYEATSDPVVYKTLLPSKCNVTKDVGVSCDVCTCVETDINYIKL